MFQSCDQVFYKRSDSGYWKEAGTAIRHDNKVRHGGVYLLVNPYHLELVNKSKKAGNVGTNKVEPNFQERTEIAEPKKKISSNTNIDHTTDNVLEAIKNASNKSCPDVEQPTEDDESTLSDVLDYVELDENDCELRNQTQITGTVPSLKRKMKYQDPDTDVSRKVLFISGEGKVSGANKN